MNSCTSYSLLQGSNWGFCLAYKFSFLLWKTRMFPYKSLIEICRLLSVGLHLWHFDLLFVLFYRPLIHTLADVVTDRVITCKQHQNKEQGMGRMGNNGNNLSKKFTLSCSPPPPNFFFLLTFLDLTLWRTISNLPAFNSKLSKTAVKVFIQVGRTRN